MKVSHFSRLAKGFWQVYACEYYESSLKLVTAKVVSGMKVKTWNSKTFSPWIVSNIQYALTFKIKSWKMIGSSCVIKIHVMSTTTGVIVEYYISAIRYLRIQGIFYLLYIGKLQTSAKVFSQQFDEMIKRHLYCKLILCMDG